jgi:hypothetical protein
VSKSLGRVHVIGMGEVGRRLAAALTGAGVEVLPVTRDAGWPEALRDPGALLLVCVREEALASVLARLESVVPERVVLMQNGWIRPLLGRFGAATRGLIWFTSKGAFFRVLRPSVLAGPVAEPLAEALARGRIAAEVVPDAAFAVAEVEKMGFNCVVGLPLAVHGLSLGGYLTQRCEEADALFAESVAVPARVLGASVSSSWWPTFLTVAGPLDGVRVTAAKALEFRNGAVLRLAREHGLAVPVTERLLAAAGFSL